jgi:pimeloyl-ACP methyl ester carboxylesterase
MAQDLVTVMERLGFPRFSVAGHDRGGRVAYRMALWSAPGPLGTWYAQERADRDLAGMG